jgi:tetratricopeptide (TPR) repeat protein
MTLEGKLAHLDSLYEQNKIDEAEKFLLDEVNDETNSRMIRISLNNELMGIFRNKGNKDACMKQLTQQLIWIADAGEMLDPVSEATLYLNIANAYQAFDMAEESYDILCKVEDRYKSNSGTEPYHMASLYNNKAVVLMKLKDLDQAEVYFKMALKILETLRESEDEIAVTYQNLSSIYSAKGRYQLALDMTRRGEELLQAAGWGVSYHAGAIANSTAMIYHAMGDYENALAYFKKSANIILQVYGDCGLYRSILESMEAVKAKMGK